MLLAVEIKYKINHLNIKLKMIINNLELSVVSKGQKI